MWKRRAEARLNNLTAILLSSPSAHYAGDLMNVDLMEEVDEMDVDAKVDMDKVLDTVCDANAGKWLDPEADCLCFPACQEPAHFT
eukprot:1161821-Pelagomonas_calceolata.AAC.6